MARTKYACDVCGESFATAEALRTRCREYIDVYLSPESGLEQEMSETHSAFFIELVRIKDPHRIPEGVFVRRVVRCCRDGQRGRHVRFEYSDGTSDMIGWAKLCGGRRATFTQISNAMREAVRDQMQAAYSSFFLGKHGGTCPHSGTEISHTGEFHGDRAVVHHEGFSFAQIRDMWFEQTGTKPEDITLKDLFDGGGYTLAAGWLCDSWKAFHLQKATLVVVSEKWHRTHHSSTEPHIVEQVA